MGRLDAKLAAPDDLLFDRNSEIGALRQVSLRGTGNGIIRDPEAAACVELPISRTNLTQGIPLEEFPNHPLLQRRLTGFPFHFGRPSEVREAFARAINIR